MKILHDAILLTFLPLVDYGRVLISKHFCHSAFHAIIGLGWSLKVWVGFKNLADV